MEKIENLELLNTLKELNVGNFYLCDEETGLEMYSGTLESHEITLATSTEDVKGGTSGDVLYTIDKSKDISIKVVDVYSRRDMEAAKWGGVIKKGRCIVQHMPRNYTVENSESNLKVTLDREPYVGESVAVYNNKTNKKIEASKLQIAGKVITITGEEGLVAGDTVHVTGFKTEVDNVEYVNIDNAVPSKAMRCVIEIPIYTNDNRLYAYKQYIFPKAQMSGSLTTKGQAEKGKNTFETELKVQRDIKQQYMGTVAWIPVTPSGVGA